MSLDTSDLEKFEHGLEEADIDKMERILELIDPERLEPGLVDLDLYRLGRELETSAERMESMLLVVPDMIARSRTGKVAKSEETPGYVASSDSNRYHRPECRWAKKIASGNKIRFSSPKEAQDRGYTPCGVCKPS
ncbi:MAG TPA: hypothetical protein HA349_01490 [Methanotrichaceae archaeon]|nr:hypothetical protein [Methanotrichaceae archaeon]